MEYEVYLRQEVFEFLRQGMSEINCWQCFGSFAVIPFGEEIFPSVIEVVET